MSFLELAKDRYSVRRFSDRKVEDEKLAKILYAAHIAPTANNNQPQKIYVLQSEDALRRVNYVSKHIFGASTVLMVCYDKNLAWHNPHTLGYHSGQIDASIACDHIMLAAWDLGIGSCFVGAFEHKQLASVFNLPYNIIPLALLPIGYPAEDSAPLPAHSTYRDLSEMVTVI